MEITIKTLAQLRNTLEASGHKYRVSESGNLRSDRPPGFNFTMNDYLGETLTVSHLSPDGTRYIAERWHWDEWMINKKEGTLDE